MAELSPNSVTNQIRKSVKRKKIIMRSIVGGVSALILGLGVGFIAIGINRPYTTIDLNLTKLSIPDNYQTDINQRSHWKQDYPLDLMVLFNNHHQKKQNEYKLMDNAWFMEHRGTDDLYWTLQIDKNHKEYFDELRIDSELGTLSWNDENASPISNDEFTIWISVELMIHGFENETVLVSNPITMTITYNSGQM